MVIKRAYSNRRKKFMMHHIIIEETGKTLCNSKSFIWHEKTKDFEDTMCKRCESKADKLGILAKLKLGW